MTAATIRKRKSPSPGGTRGTVKKSVKRDKEHYPTATVNVHPKLCQDCTYSREIPRPIRSRSFCAFTGEPLYHPDAGACEFFILAEGGML